MDNSSYSSLTDKLIRSGILSDTTYHAAKEEFENLEHNFFENQNPIIEEIETKEEKKRINQYDLELIGQEPTDNQEKSVQSKNIIFKLFPKIYKAKLAKEAIEKLKTLNIDTKSLSDKFIPYGEGEIRYQNLIKYLKYANELQAKFKDKT